MEEEYKDFDNIEDFFDDLQDLSGMNLIESIDMFFRRLKRHILDIKTSMVHAWQRLFRGWDDSVLWSIDDYLADMMPIWLGELKKRQRGAPFEYLPQKKALDRIDDEDIELAQMKWFSDIDIVIAGFEAYKTMEYAGSELTNRDELQKVYESGMKKLSKMFHTLWW
jgi:hypothetical protein